MSGADPSGGAHARASEFWEDVVTDMEATADEYEEEGWETIQLHPGGVTVLTTGERSDRYGLDVLVPDDEFAEVQALLDDGATFDSYEVFRAASADLVFLVVAVEAAEREVAALYPAYYDETEGEAMLAEATENGEMHTYVRTLTEDRIEFTHDEPSMFGPPEEAESGEEAET